MNMKSIMLALFTLVFTGLKASAQISPGDRINGTWLTEKKDGKIQIFRTGDTYSGKLLWGTAVFDENGKPRYDVNNPDPKLRTRLLLGMVILTGLVYKDGKWENGEIYDGLTGKSYSVIITLKGNSLELRGYIGLPILGKTTVWQRIQ
jgi:uncharacterized protein (DUF2147 family)